MSTVQTAPTLFDWLQGQTSPICTTTQHASLRTLLLSVADSCMHISDRVAAGGLGNALGSLGSENVQGEVQQKLDMIANTQLIHDVAGLGCVAALASEEMEHIHVPSLPAQAAAPYLLLFDPLDGSSNIDVNVSIGTIFSVLQAQKQAPQKQAPENAAAVQESDFLQPGQRQIAAGYAIYGPQTMLVLTLGQGVAGFTLEPASPIPHAQPGVRHWRLTHPDLSIPADTREFAINMSNMRHWDTPIRRYVEDCLAGETGPLGKNYNMRWIASMVADVHRILMRGGLFMYPRDARAASRHGKLRLLYEANPMSFLIEQAGGAAITENPAENPPEKAGTTRLLDVPPHTLHQRIGVILGSRNEVQRVATYYTQST